MKKLLTAVASLAVVVTPLAASAQSYGHGQYGGGWGGRDSQQRDYGHHDVYRGYSGRSDDRNYRRYDDRSDNASTAIFAGLAGLVVGSALSSHPTYGYSQPYNQPYGYGDHEYAPSYGYQRNW